MDGSVSAWSEDMFQDYLSTSFKAWEWSYKYYLDDRNSSRTLYGSLEYLWWSLWESIEWVKQRVSRLCHFVRKSDNSGIEYVSRKSWNVHLLGQNMVDYMQGSLNERYCRQTPGSPEISASEIQRASWIVSKPQGVWWNHIPEWYVYSWELDASTSSKIQEYMREHEGKVFSTYDIWSIMTSEEFSRVWVWNVCRSIISSSSADQKSLYLVKNENKWRQWNISYYVFCKKEDFSAIKKDFLSSQET